MGMFDWLKLEVPLPDTGEVPHDEQFQTKDLEHMLDQYVIAEDGHLYLEKWDHVWADDTKSFLGGYLERIEGSYRREIVPDYHGDIHFYHDAVRDIDGKRIWHEYIARFTDGKLSRISVVETPLE